MTFFSIALAAAAITSAPAEALTNQQKRDLAQAVRAEIDSFQTDFRFALAELVTAKENNDTALIAQKRNELRALRGHLRNSFQEIRDIWAGNVASPS